MSDATCEIKIYPDKEMLALDMAEILRSLALTNGAILQGCRMEIPNGTTKLTISSGRIFIRGRMAEVTGGDLPAPTDLATAQACYVLAVYRPSNTPPFYVKICTSQEKDALDAIISQETQDASYDLNFNVRSCTSYMTLGTVTVAAGTGAVSNFVPNSLNYPHKNNQSVVASQIATVNNTINNKESALNSSIAAAINTAHDELTGHAGLNSSQYQYLNARTFNKLNSTLQTHKLVDYTVTYPTVDIAAGASVDVSFEHGYGITHSITINGSAVSRSISGKIGNTRLPSAAYTPTTDSRGYATTVDPRLHAIAIAAISLSNAAKGGGKNVTKCVVQWWGFGDEICHVRVLNTGTSAACIDVGVKFLYTTHE